MKEINCQLCSNIFFKKGRQKYCDECKQSGEARKDILKHYNSSDKNKANQKRWYYSNIPKTRTIKNRYNRSEKGKKSKLKYYYTNKQVIIERVKKNIKATISRTNAHDKVKRLKIPKICILCGATKKLHVHHKDENPFNNDIKNLVILCSSCHGKEHEALNQNFTLLR